MTAGMTGRPVTADTSSTAARFDGFLNATRTPRPSSAYGTAASRTADRSESRRTTCGGVFRMSGHVT